MGAYNSGGGGWRTRTCTLAAPTPSSQPPSPLSPSPLPPPPSPPPPSPSPPPPRVHLRITTGTSAAADGTLDVQVDDGSGYAWVTTGQNWAKGSTVLDALYHTLSGVRVRGPTRDGWVGAIEYSSDGGVTYAPFVCTDCTKGSSTAHIAVDGDSMNAAPPTTCFGGATCALSPPAIFTTKGYLKTAVQEFNADP